MLLYIHIPFCDSKCFYCAFNSYVGKRHLQYNYMLALEKQLLFELERFDIKKSSIESLFIGGGTPSTISPSLYKPIFQLIKPYLRKDAEITSEANPNSSTQEWLEEMYALGVNRISFGVQSFNEEKLKLLNRAHTPQMAKDALLSANSIGFKNLSLDLIYATQKDTKELLKNDIKEAFELPINHISLYALTIEEGTPFEKKPQMAKEDISLSKWLFQNVEEHGFKQYEISNFGKYRSKHNLGYWEYKDYIGIGAGAVGKIEKKRFYPNQNIEEYIRNPLQAEIEHLNSEDIRLEKIFLGFRSSVGVKEKLLNSKEKKQASLLLKERKLSFKKDTFYNPNYLLADEVTLFLTS